MDIIKDTKENIKIFDTHCHPQLPQYDSDRGEVIRRALDAGIGMVCVGTDLTTSKQAIELAGRYEGLYASIGLHPNDNLDEAYDQGSYIKLAHLPKVIAIGEIGLDYYRTADPDKREFQKSRFLQQLELARLVKKPIIIHCRDAHADMLDILKDESGSLRGVIHSFNGSVAQARSYLDGGFYIGLNGIVTFSKSYNEMVQSLPLDRILLETDAPFLSPVPHRGKRNEPLYIVAVGNYIAEIRGESADEIFRTTTGNAATLLDIQA